MSKPYQVAAIPFRRGPSGGVEVLLVTSRETRRWVIPKGWPWRNVKDHDAAAGEAWEEAGVHGLIDPRSLGSFTYPKQRKDKVTSLEVIVYRLEVTEEAERWPEHQQRERRWLHQSYAAELVSEHALKQILRDLIAD